MSHATHSVLDLPDVVARMGYSWMELSPKDDFIPFFRHPRADDATVTALRKARCGRRRRNRLGAAGTSVVRARRGRAPGRRTGVEAANPDDGRPRRATVMNSEFNGRSRGQPERRRGASSCLGYDELAPVFEAEDVTLVLEPHPDDFVEDGHAAVNMVPAGSTGTQSSSSTGYLLAEEGLLGGGHADAAVVADVEERWHVERGADAEERVEPTAVGPLAIGRCSRPRPIFSFGSISSPNADGRVVGQSRPRCHLPMQAVR